MSRSFQEDFLGAENMKLNRFSDGFIYFSTWKSCSSRWCISVSQELSTIVSSGIVTGNVDSLQNMAPIGNYLHQTDGKYFRLLSRLDTDVWNHSITSLCEMHWSKNCIVLSDLLIVVWSPLNCKRGDCWVRLLTKKHDTRASFSSHRGAPPPTDHSV